MAESANTPSIDAEEIIRDLRPRQSTVEATRLRARLVLDRAIDRIASALDDEDNVMPVNELAQVTNALSRIALPAVDGEKGNVTVTVVRVQAPASAHAISAIADPAPAVIADVSVETRQLVTPQRDTNDSCDDE